MYPFLLGIGPNSWCSLYMGRRSFRVSKGNFSGGYYTWVRIIIGKLQYIWILFTTGNTDFFTYYIGLCRSCVFYHFATLGMCLCFHAAKSLHPPCLVLSISLALRRDPCGTTSLVWNNKRDFKMTSLKIIMTKSKTINCRIQNIMCLVNHTNSRVPSQIRV